MAETPDAPEKPEEYPAKAALIWKIINLGIPAVVVLSGLFISKADMAFMVVLCAHGFILLANFPLSFALGRNRFLTSVGIYLGSVLLGGGLTFVGCMVNLDHQRL
jgi:hypothetical protein